MLLDEIAQRLKCGLGQYWIIKGYMTSGPIQPKWKRVELYLTEDVYEMPFNEKNLKELASLRENDTNIQFSVKDEASGNPVEVKKEANFNKTLELFLKPFDYLFKAEYITPQQKAELRQMAIDAGTIAPSTPLKPQITSPPKGTYS